MTVLKYERLSHVIALASIEPGDTRINQELQLKESEVQDKTLSISFSDYVKSQLHFYMVNKPGRKSFFKYANALKYLSGNVAYRDDAIELLRCFYNDVAAFLLHSELDLDVLVNADIESVDVWKGNVKETKDSITELFDYGSNPDEHFKEYLEKSKYSWLLDIVDDVSEGKKLLNNLSRAAVILEMLQDTKTYKYVEV